MVGISSKMGVTSATLFSLINGEVGVGISGKLGVTTSSLQTFLDGGTSIGLAAKIGCTSRNLQTLRSEIGKEGAIGLIIGLCIKSST